MNPGFETPHATSSTPSAPTPPINNRERPHRGLALAPPEAANAASPPHNDEIKRRDQLGGLIHEYYKAAA